MKRREMKKVLEERKHVSTKRFKEENERKKNKFGHAKRQMRRTDGRTDGQTLLQRCVDASKNGTTNERTQKKKDKDKRKQEIQMGKKYLCWGAQNFHIWGCSYRKGTVKS